MHYILKLIIKAIGNSYETALYKTIFKKVFIMTTEKKDLRFRKTEISIRSAFFELLKSKRISEITVAEISRKAMLGRGTFYLHYKDIHDLLDALENEYIEDIGNIIDEYYPIPPSASISELTEKLFRYLNAHEEKLRLLFDHISTRHFIDRLIIRQRYVFNRLAEQSPDPAYSAVETSFMISGFAGVILDYWFLGSLHLSEKEIIRSLNRLLLNYSRAKKEMKQERRS